MASEQSNPALSPELSPAMPEAIGEVQAPAEFRPDQVERALFEIQSEQRLLVGTIAGAIAGTIGAIVWAVVTVVTMSQLGLLAVGIGLLVGAAVRWGGRGTTQTFGIVGGAIALISVVAGNFLSLLGLWAGAEGISYLEAASSFPYSHSLALMAATFSPIDLLFYGIAVWEGYRFSIREVTPEEIRERLAADGVTPAR